MGRFDKYSASFFLSFCEYFYLKGVTHQATKANTLSTNSVGVGIRLVCDPIYRQFSKWLINIASYNIIRK